MDIKYYDLLSTAIIGVALIAVINYVFMGNVDIDGIVYLVFGYITGYFINAIGSVLEPIYYKTIGGKPSDLLLTLVPGQNWTGYGKVRFYAADNVIKLLKKELNDPNASAQFLFEYAMKKVNNCKDTRVQAFNAQYAWSRTILTSVLLSNIVFAFRFYNEWIFWIIGLLLLFLSWNRFKERGYYYAREVLNEYIKQEKL